MALNVTALEENISNGFEVLGILLDEVVDFLFGSFLNFAIVIGIITLVLGVISAIYIVVRKRLTGSINEVDYK